MAGKTLWSAVGFIHQAVGTGTMTRDLRLGCKDYPWIEPLMHGEVEPPGIDLTVVDDLISPQYFERMLEGEAFDVAELSLGTYLAAMERPEYDVTAIPVFPHRRFRHAFLYIRKGSAFETPEDLHGASIGMPNWKFSAGLWLRGILADRHGLDLQSVDWRIGGPEVIPPDVGEAYSVSELPPHPAAKSGRENPIEEGGTGSLRAIERLLSSGQLDAVITPTEYRNDDLERLFDDPFGMERDYYRETGIFPIMHVLALDTEIATDGLPQRLYEAFDEALEAKLAEIREPGWFKRSPFVWSLEALESEAAFFEENPWEYGLTEDNRKTLRTAIRYATEQGIVDEAYAVEDLFVDGIGH
jgi:4,5-dihydroxyphthalate decarboxylase